MVVRLASESVNVRAVVERMGIDALALARAVRSALIINAFAVLCIWIPTWVDDPEIELNWLMMIPVGILLLPGIVFDFIVSRAIFDLGGVSVFPISLLAYTLFFYPRFRRLQR